MGSLSNFNLQFYINRYKLNVFVESGTGGGDSVIFSQMFNFEKIYSFEYIDEIAQLARQRTNDLRTKIITSDSITGLKNILKELNNDRILFWLDAHYPGLDHTENQILLNVSNDIKLPLEKELETIKKLRPENNDVILIDDLRIYINWLFEKGNLPDGEHRGDQPLGKPLGNIDFIYDIFDETHYIRINPKHTGYLILTPKRG